MDAVLSPQEQLQIPMMKEGSRRLSEAAQISLLLLRRIAGTLCDIALPRTSHSTTTTTDSDDNPGGRGASTIHKRREAVMQAVEDRQWPIVLDFFPTMWPEDGGSGGAAMFLTLFALFFGLQVKLNLAVTGVISLGGMIYEVSAVAISITSHRHTNQH